ncbi:MAG TPA: hypothetical protein VFU85_04895 [Nocardioides sp.]|nr:hypothetical protein [Nocardioides sp.]
MSRRVYLHIGAPKTGTTYLQDRLSLNAASLADHGVHFPSRSPLVSPGLFHFRAALDLLGQDWGGEPGHAIGNWDALVKRIHRKPGSVIVSHEILAPARAEHVARAMADLEGTEVHVVYSARDLGRAVPAAWQESIKQGRRWSYRKFLRQIRQGKPWFFRAFDLPTVLATWGAGLPPERIHVVTVPQRTDPTLSPPQAPTSKAGPSRPAAGDPLWLRFCEACGIDPAWAPRDSTRTNQSLGVAETQLIRQLNRRLDRATRRESSYDALIREMLAQDELVGRTSAPVRLPPADYDWAEQVSEHWIDYLQESGVHVVGDYGDLRPMRPAEGARWRDPDRVPPRQRLQVSLDALAAMTREAAARPDPEQRLTHRMRQRAERLRGQ